MVVLPVELVAEIFRMVAVPRPARNGRDRKLKKAYVQGRISLRACTLVCRRWRDIAQAILFHGVSMTLHERSLQEIHDFFAQTPHLSSFIYSLHLERISRQLRPAFAGGLNPWRLPEAVVDTSTSCGSSIVLLIDTLRLFPNLLSVKLEDILYPPAAPSELLHIKNARLAVDSLEIDLTYRESQECSRGMRELLACFTSVSHLRIKGVAHTAQNVSCRFSSAETALMFPQVKTLDFNDSFCEQHVLTTLAMSSHATSLLHRLDISHLDSAWKDMLPALQSLLAAVGHQLTHLRCNVANFSYSKFLSLICVMRSLTLFRLRQ